MRMKQVTLTETSLKIVDLSWKYKKNNNEKIKIECQWDSEISLSPTCEKEKYPYVF
jgi:hypothetical protein